MRAANHWSAGLPLAIVLNVHAALALQPDPAMLRGVFEVGLARRQQQYGVFDARTAEAARNLGVFLSRQGERSDARNILDQVVRIDEKVFGPNAPQTLADVAELANVSVGQEAEPLWRRAAETNDANVAAGAFAALGRLHTQMDDRRGAALYYRRALAKEEAAGHKDGAEAALYLNALAKLVDAAEAIPLVERALAIDRRVLGTGHPETATTEGNLAGLLVDTARNEEAIRLATEALAVFRQTLGMDQPRTAVAASILGYAFEVKGDRKQAEQMYRLALAVDERAYGSQHPQTLKDARVLGEFLGDKGPIGPR
jgi:tetratricopeptide (TPR) repeat protein